MSKNPIRGKRLTVRQKKILMKNNKNPDDFLYIGETTKIDEKSDSLKKICLNKTMEKIVLIQFIHKNTGEIISIDKK